jgi:hypothetical protein
MLYQRGRKVLPDVIPKTKKRAEAFIRITSRLETEWELLRWWKLVK